MKGNIYQILKIYLLFLFLLAICSCLKDKNPLIQLGPIYAITDKEVYQYQDTISLKIFNYSESAINFNWVIREPYPNRPDHTLEILRDGHWEKQCDCPHSPVTLETLQPFDSIEVKAMLIPLYDCMDAGYYRLKIPYSNSTNEILESNIFRLESQNPVPFMPMEVGNTWKYEVTYRSNVESARIYDLSGEEIWKIESYDHIARKGIIACEFSGTESLLIRDIREGGGDTLVNDTTHYAKVISRYEIDMKNTILNISSCPGCPDSINVLKQIRGRLRIKMVYPDEAPDSIQVDFWGLKGLPYDGSYNLVRNIGIIKMNYHELWCGVCTLSVRHILLDYNF